MQPVIELYSSAELAASDRAAIVKMCSEAFDCDYDAFLRSFGTVTHVLARVDRVIASHALWCTRWLQPEGLQPLRTAYVEAVVTLPEYQKRGYASMLLRHIEAAIADYELGALGPSDEAFYSRLGWEMWRGPLSVRTDKGSVPAPEDEVMVLRLPGTPPLDLNAPMSAEWREMEVW